MSSAIAPIRTAGIATGLALAALLVLSFQVPASGQSLGAGVRMLAMAPGEVHVPRAGAFLSARGLTPGGEPARGSLPVTNVTRGAVDVRLRARKGGRELDRSLHVELRAGGRRLASGPLSRLRHWSRSLRVERGEERIVRVRAWIPAGTPGTAGRRVALQLALDAELVKATRR
ncbi:MAG TPA: hypothetical protein VER75_02535 [Thermoleophilaceae bacterium]|nr:hypothetical protein [Thermoleophilaceae bacterium]